MKTELLLRAADLIEGLSPRDFDMNDPKSCIIGHCVRDPQFVGLKAMCSGEWPTDMYSAAVFFGLNREQAAILFQPGEGVLQGKHSLDGGALFAYHAVPDGKLGEKATPREAAAHIRRMVIQWGPKKAQKAVVNSKKAKPAASPGMKAIKKAIDEVQKITAPTIREEIEHRVKMARNRWIADELLGVGLSEYRHFNGRIR